MSRRFAYADPPYLGCARRYYGDKHPEAAAFDQIDAHRALIHRLCDDFPDGWALSCHVPSLQALLSLCPADVRIAAWCKPFSGVRPFIRARFGWEPVIYMTDVRWAHGPQFVDYLIEDGNRSNVARSLFPGRKPERFAAWVADLLGFRPGDTIEDLFPGSGAVSRAFEKLPQRDPEQFELCGVAA